MKKLFENWRLFTEAKRGEPFNKFLVDTDVDWELPDWWADEPVRPRSSAAQDRSWGTDPEMEIPKASRRPSATPPPLPPEATPRRMRPPPLPPEATPPLPEPDIGAGLPTDRGPTRFPPEGPPPLPSEAPDAPKGKKVTFHVPGIGNVRPEDGDEAFKIIANISDKHNEDIEAITQATRKHQLTPEIPTDETEEISTGERRVGNKRNKASLMSRVRSLGGKILGAIHIGTILYLIYEFWEDIWSGFTEEYPDMDDQEKKAAVMGVVAFMLVADVDVGGDPLSIARPEFGIGPLPGQMPSSQSTTDVLLDALGIADAVENARQEREAKEKMHAKKRAEKEKAAAEKEKAATARAIARRNQEDYPASTSRGNVTPEEPDIGPVPDRDLRENFKRTNKIKKLNIIIS